MTKYYKLLKDLPTFEKGDLFRLSDEGHLFMEKSDFNHWKSKVLAYDNYTLEHFPNILEDWFEEVEAPKERWKPKEGDKYYYIRSYGYDRIIACSRWPNDYFNQAGNEIGNVYRTREEAERAVEWLKARKVLYDDAKGFRPNWKDEQERKWSVVWVWRGINGLVIDFKTSETHGYGPYFATAEDARASIKAHEREWKIYLGVEE